MKDSDRTETALFNALCDIDLLADPGLDNWPAVADAAIRRLNHVIVMLNEARDTELTGHDKHRVNVASGLHKGLRSFVGGAV